MILISDCKASSNQGLAIDKKMYLHYTKFMRNSFSVPLFGNRPAIELRDLAPVNYLVGDNGSGKSFVMEQLALQKNITYIRNSLDIRAWEKLNNQHFPISFPLEIDVFETIGIPLDGFDGNIHWQEWLSIEQQKDTFDFIKRLKPLKQGTEGQYKFWNMFLLFSYLCEHHNCPFFLIEEPETHLHPQIQKEFPVFLQQLHEAFGWQFLVSTHSPFVISSSARITAEQGKTFDPKQKVYFLKHMGIVNKRGNYSKDAELGYWGSKCIDIAAEMVGAGLQDLYSPQEVIVTGNSPTIIFCEGQGMVEDASVYNAIFANRSPAVLFVSSRGSSQLAKSYQLLKQIQAGLSANVRMLMLRDRDHEFPTDGELEAYENKFDGVKILRRRAIECYIFNVETLHLVQKAHDAMPTEKQIRVMQKAEQLIARWTAEGRLGHEYKGILRNTFLDCIDNLQLSYEVTDSIEMHIVGFITPQTQIYKELETIIFGSI
jgi:hypothetical protein